MKSLRWGMILIAVLDLIVGGLFLSVAATSLPAKPEIPAASWLSWSVTLVTGFFLLGAALSLFRKERFPQAVAFQGKAAAGALAWYLSGWVNVFLLPDNDSARGSLMALGLILFLPLPFFALIGAVWLKTLVQAERCEGAR